MTQLYKIKRLKWNEVRDEDGARVCFTAGTLVCQVSVFQKTTGRWLCICGNETVESDFPTLHEAKSAAESHYRESLSPSLVEVPIQPLLTDAKEAITDYRNFETYSCALEHLEASRNAVLQALEPVEDA